MGRSGPEEIVKHEKRNMSEKYFYILECGFLLVLIVIWLFNIYISLSQGAIFWQNLGAIPILAIPLYYYVKRGEKARALFTVLTIFLILYLFTFSLERIKTQNDIISQIIIFDETGKDYYKNVTFHSLDSRLIFDSDRTFLVEKIFFTAPKLGSPQNFTFCFLMPDKETMYRILLYGQSYEWNGKILEPVNFTLINTTNNTVVTNDTRPCFYGIRLENFGAYNLEVSYNFPKKDPLGSIWISVIGWIGPQIVSSMYVTVSFSDMLYECMTPCVLPFSENATVFSGFKGSYHYVYPEMEKPVTIQTVQANDVHEIRFALRTSHKYPLIFRALILSIIAGLIVGIVQSWLMLRRQA